MEKYYRLFHPMRTVLVTANADGKDNVMTAAWCFPLSMDPPLFGVSLATKRFTYGMIEKSKEFALNLPRDGMEESVRICGTMTGRDTDKFKEAKLTKEKSKEIAASSIAECSATIECRLEEVIETGDHMLVVGRVVNVVKRKEAKGVYQKGSDLVAL